jgi:hypothetical protein
MYLCGMAVFCFAEISIYIFLNRHGMRELAGAGHGLGCMGFQRAAWIRERERESEIGEIDQVVDIYINEECFTSVRSWGYLAAGVLFSCLPT